MPNTSRYTAIIDLDVINAEDESAARQAIFNMLSASGIARLKTGRPSAGAKASITGIRIDKDEPDQTVFTAKLDSCCGVDQYPGLPDSAKAEVLES